MAEPATSSSPATTTSPSGGFTSADELTDSARCLTLVEVHILLTDAQESCRDQGTTGQEFQIMGGHRPVTARPAYRFIRDKQLRFHPSAQAWLADVFIDVVNNRNVQVILESHSEHFLRRLQRRIAEEAIAVDKTALYFCRMENSSSMAEMLDIDMFGDIRNWRRDFFGDEMGELTAKTEAAMRRQGALNS